MLGGDCVKPRIAFELDNTLGEVLVHHLSNNVIGLSMRPGCIDLLSRAQSQYTLCLWTTSSRWYLDAAMSFGLKPFFEETYAGDEIVCDWKDVRRLGLIYLIDDSVWHRDHAAKEGLDTTPYIVVPAYRSLEDQNDPHLWVRVVDNTLFGSKARTNTHDDDPYYCVALVFALFICDRCRSELIGDDPSGESYRPGDEWFHRLGEYARHLRWHAETVTNSAGTHNWRVLCPTCNRKSR